jgi:hypothetical protein
VGAGLRKVLMCLPESPEGFTARAVTMVDAEVVTELVVLEGRDLSIQSLES